MSSKISCNKCKLEKFTEDFNPSDLACRVYMCKLCKQEYRKQLRHKKNLNQLPDLIICRVCKFGKTKDFFDPSSLKNSDYICSRCRGERDILYQRERRSKTQ